MTCRILLLHHFDCSAEETFVATGLDPVTRDYVEALSEHQPAFVTAAENIRIIQQPDIFYRQFLVSMFLSSFTFED